VEGGNKMSNHITRRQHAMLLTQYQQVCEDRRQKDSFIWQLIPPFAATIGGTLVVVVFSAMAPAPLPAKVFVLCIAFFLTMGIAFIMKRHRYFQAISVGTLAMLEDKLEVKHVQRTPFPRLDDENEYDTSRVIYPKKLLYPVAPKSVWDDGISGPRLFFVLLLLMSIGIIGLIIFVLICPPTCIPLAHKIFSWVIFGVILGVSIGSICCLHSKEKKNIADEKLKIQKYEMKNSNNNVEVNE